MSHHARRARNPLAIRIVHTADWQLGKPFGSIAGDAGGVLRRERFEAVRRVAELASATRAEAVLVAGDVFDGSDVADATIHACLQALEPFRGPWVLLPGNHDPALAAGVWTRLERLGRPAHVLVAREPAPLALADGRLVVLPAPLQRRHEGRDLTEWFDAAETPAGALRVGLAHGAVADRLPAGTEAPNPIAADRAVSARLDYLALGDWHGTVEIAPRTWYAGTPERDRFRANDAGNALVVDLEPGADPRVDVRATGRFRWHDVDCVLDAAPAQAIEDRLAAQPGADRDCVVALRLSGHCTLAGREAVDAALARWHGRLLHLEVADESHADPSDDELDAIDTGGFVRVAVDRLRALAAGADPQADVARAALARLYREHRRLSG